MHRETLAENSRLVDLNEKMQKQLNELQEEVMIHKARRGPVIHSDDSSSPGMGIRVSTAYIGSDGRVPMHCPRSVRWEVAPTMTECTKDWIL